MNNSTYESAIFVDDSVKHLDSVNDDRVTTFADWGMILTKINIKYMITYNFDQKTVIVTGGAKRIGLDTAINLLNMELKFLFLVKRIINN